MKNLAKLVLAASALASSACGGMYGRKGMKEQDICFKAGIETAIKGAKPSKGAVPESVKAEARYPTLYSPHSGNHWEGEQIGSYDPCRSYGIFDIGAYAKMSPNTGIPITPYAKVLVKGSFGPTENTDYLHEVDMRGANPSEWVLYIYNITRRNFPLEPEAGLTIDLKHFAFSLGGSYERTEMLYYKGIESYGEPKFQNIGRNRNNIINIKAGIDLLNWDSGEVILGGIFATGDERGGGGFLSMGLSF
jgi:hypothetical protein